MMGGAQSRVDSGGGDSSSSGGGVYRNKAAAAPRTKNNIRNRYSTFSFTSLYPSSLTTTRCDDGATPSPPPPPPPPTLPSDGSAKPAAPPPPPPGVVDGAADKDADSIAEAAQAASAYTNPGPYEQAAMEGKRLVTLDTFDGFRCDINKQVSPFMAVVHSFWLGTSMIPDGRKSTYSFLTQVADEQGLLMSRVDFGRGGFDGRVHRALLGGLAMAKIQTGVTADGQGDQLLAELDFGGLTWTGNLKYGSMGGGIVLGCNYFQSITPKLAMGGEGMYIAANQSYLGNYTLKYTIPARTGDEDAALKPAVTPRPAAAPGMPPQDDAGSSTMCVNYNGGQSTLTMNYKRVVTPNRVTLAAELQCSPLSLESQVMLGGEFKLQRSKMQLCVDGGGRIQSLLEAKLGMGPGSPTLNFSADVDHFKDEMRFGYGINIDG